MEEEVFCPLHCKICSWTRIKKQIFYFTTGHLRHKLGKHQAVRAVKAVPAHNPQDAMHQYVMTNLSLRDTIRGRQEPPVICWRERRLTSKERQRSIKWSALSGRRGHSYVISPEASLYAFHFQVSIGYRQGAKLPKGARFRQQVLSCVIPGSGGR